MILILVLEFLIILSVSDDFQRNKHFPWTERCADSYYIFTLKLIVIEGK